MKKGDRLEEIFQHQRGLQARLNVPQRIKKTMGHPHLKVGVCKAPCFLDDPKLKTVRLLPHSKECGFKFMDIKKSPA